jgi:hypothetical protein
VGIVMGCIVGMALYYGGRQIKDLKVFFWISTFLLLLVAAGQVSLGTWQFTQGQVWGPAGPFLNRRPWLTRPAYNIQECCNTANDAPNKFFPLMRAIFGFSDKPNPMELFMYFG